MNRSIFLSVWIFLLTTLVVQAEHPTPLATHLGDAKNVYLAKVTSLDGGKVTFTITEVLRGQLIQTLRVTSAGGAEVYSQNSEWLLVSCSYGLENAVGWDEDRPAAWIPGAIHHLDGQIYITDWLGRVPTKKKPGFGIDWDQLPDGTWGLTLDHVKRILAEHPPKP